MKELLKASGFHKVLWTGWVTLLKIMNIITILLCALANQVTGQTNEFFPARILAQQKTISESSDLHLTCSTFGLKKQILVYVYLCKDDFVMEKKNQKQDQIDTTFTVEEVGLDDSGNYSCVYSLEELELSRVDKRGINVIQIVVISNFLPADISVVGPSTVTEGDHVEFRCAVSDTLQTLGGCQLIHSYLMRNETILQVQGFNIASMEATFTIQGAVMRDSGNYSCVVLPSRCIQQQEKTLFGNNAVLLEVKASLVFQVIISCGVIISLLSPWLCLWLIKKQVYSAPANSRAASQQANAEVVEEQQVQAEAEDLEAQDGDSFSSDEAGEYQNAVAAVEDLTYSGCEAVYSFVDDPPAGPNSVSVYAKCQKRKIHA